MPGLGQLVVPSTASSLVSGNRVALRAQKCLARVSAIDWTFGLGKQASIARLGRSLALGLAQPGLAKNRQSQLTRPKKLSHLQMPFIGYALSIDPNNSSARTIVR